MTTNTFQGERPVFLREQANKMYGVLPYFIAKILAELPVFIIVPLIFNAITYFSIGYNRIVEQFFMFQAAYTLNTLCAISFGYLISSAIKNQAMALALAPIVAMPLLLVGGFYSNQETAPIYIEVFSYISPLQYVFNMIAKLQFTNSENQKGKELAEFLDITRPYEEGLLYLCIEVVVFLFVAFILLKTMIDRFQ